MNQNQNRGIDALHGGLAVYDGSTDKFVFQYCSDTLVKLICGDRSEFEALTRGNALQIVCECDREQVEQALRVAREEHTELSTHFWLKSAIFAALSATHAPFFGPMRLKMGFPASSAAACLI